MKWADKIDMMEVGRASDEAVAALMHPWARANLQLRADRDALNEHCRLAADAERASEPLSMSMFLSVADMKAEQQRCVAAQTAASSWK